MKKILSIVVMLCLTMPALAASYFLSPSGSDGNNGTSTGTPWLTPNHALNCGDTITAAAGTYAASSFNATFGTVTCAAGNNVAWLQCATFDACKVSANAAPGLAVISVNASYWGIQGWEVTDQNDPFLACFGAFPNASSPIQIHHIIFANNVANGCQGGGVSSANEGTNTVGVDYLAIVGNIVYNATTGNGECYSGISIFQPVKSDSLPGTHLFVAGNFSYDNVDANPCNGGTPTDGEGVILDVLSGSDTAGLSPYDQQVVVDNNMLIYNGQAGLETNANTSAPTYFRNNTVANNNTDGNISSGTCGQINTLGFLTVTSKTLALGNIAFAPTTQAACAFSTPYAYYVYNGDVTDKIYATYAYNASGNNVGIASSTGFASGPNLVSGTDPSFASPANPGAPSCGSSTSAPNCMATVVANFTPTASAAKGYGYQIPLATQIYDPLFPLWLCNVNLPSGLVTMGCITGSATSGGAMSGAAFH